MEFCIGVVGSCPPSVFDDSEAEGYMREAFDMIAAARPGFEFVVVSGLTNVGVLKIAYAEAERRGWRTVGITSQQALDMYPTQLYPVDERQIVGKKWGDESQAFLEMCHTLVRIGGGKQSRSEVKLFGERGGDVYEYELTSLR